MTTEKTNVYTSYFLLFLCTAAIAVGFLFFQKQKVTDESETEALKHLSYDKAVVIQETLPPPEVKEPVFAASLTEEVEGAKEILTDVSEEIQAEAVVEEPIIPAPPGVFTEVAKTKEKRIELAPIVEDSTGKSTVRTTKVGASLGLKLTDRATIAAGANTELPDAGDKEAWNRDIKAEDEAHVKMKLNF